MATAELESVAEFKRRASALGVTEDHLKALVTAGFDTFGILRCHTFLVLLTRSLW